MPDQVLGLLEKSIWEIKAVGLGGIIEDPGEEQKQSTPRDEWWGRKKTPQRRLRGNKELRGKLIKCRFTGANFAGSSLGDTPADRMAGLNFPRVGSAHCRRNHTAHSPTDNWACHHAADGSWLA